MPVSSIDYDSRAVKQGSLFFCLSGERCDGHDFAAVALSSGALCVVVDRPLSKNLPCVQVSDVRLAMGEVAAYFYESPSRKTKLIGVTGTNGKTTTTHLICQLMSATGTAGLIGTLGTKMCKGGMIEIVPAPGTERTTPQSPDLQGILSELVQRDCTAVAMEVSSHALVQGRVIGCSFDGAVFTNLTQDHLDYHLTMENYFAAKAKLFEGLEPGSSAAINLDDPWGKRLIGLLPGGVEPFGYAIDDANTTARLTATPQHYGATGTEAIIRLSDGPSVEVFFPLCGKFNLYNLLAALAAAIPCGFNLADLPVSIETLSPAPGRFEMVPRPNQDLPQCIVDYAHTPDGLRQVLATARSILPPGGKLWCVFGCGGDRDCTKRPQMGAVAAELADRCIVTSDNPRSEDPQQIIADILAGMPSLKDLEVAPERDRAIVLALENATGQDVVVIAGKGHEDYQILADRTIHFDDREQVVSTYKRLQHTQDA